MKSKIAQKPSVGQPPRVVGSASHFETLSTLNKNHFQNFSLLEIRLDQMLPQLDYWQDTITKNSENALCCT